MIDAVTDVLSKVYLVVYQINDMVHVAHLVHFFVILVSIFGGWSCDYIYPLHIMLVENCSFGCFGCDLTMRSMQILI